MDTPTYSLDRTIVIQAAPDIVFGFFTDSARWARWWGAGSTIDPRPGGKVLIRHPNAVEVSGEVLELDAPRRIVFTAMPAASPFRLALHGSQFAWLRTTAARN